MATSKTSRFELDPIKGTPRAIVLSGVKIEDKSFEIRCFVNQPYVSSDLPISSAFVYGSGESGRRLSKTDILIDIVPSQRLFSDRKNRLEIVLLNVQGQQLPSNTLDFESIEWLY